METGEVEATHHGLEGSVCGFAHAGITVSDMGRALSFYRDLLGLVVEADYVIETPYIFTITGSPGNAIRIVYLAVPQSDVHIELLEYRGCERSSQTSRPCDPGTGHLSLFVNDIAAFYRRLVAAGFSARSDSPIEITHGPRAGNKALYAADPDGYYVEVVEQASNSRQGSGR